MFSEEEVKRIYLEKVKLPPSYFKKYEIVPKCPVQGYGYKWGHHDYPRTWCVLDFIEWTKKHNIQIEHLGYTCDSDPELEFIRPLKKTKLSYPEYDLHTLSTHFKEEFDFFSSIKPSNICTIPLKRLNKFTRLLNREAMCSLLYPP